MSLKAQLLCFKVHNFQDNFFKNIFFQLNLFLDKFPIKWNVNPMPLHSFYSLLHNVEQWIVTLLLVLCECYWCVKFKNKIETEWNPHLYDNQESISTHNLWNHCWIKFGIWIIIYG